MRHARGGGKGCVDFSRMMRVIVIVLYAAAFAEKFEAAARVLKRMQRFCDRREGGARIERHSRSGNGVYDVMLARHTKGDAAQAPAFIQKIEGRATGCIVNDVAGRIIRVCHAVGNVRAPVLHKQSAHARIVRTADEHAALRKKGKEFAERIGDVVDVLIIIQMIVVNIVDQRYGWAQRQKAFHIFACLGNKHVVRADANTAVEDIHKTADVHCGVRLAGLADVRQHGSDRRFAMAARNADHILVAFGQLAERNGSLQLRNAPFLCSHTLYVRWLNRRRINDEVGRTEIVSRMADCDRNAELLQALCKRGNICIGALHGIAPVTKDLGETVHRAAADADEMDGFMVRNVRHTGFPQFFL